MSEENNFPQQPDFSQQPPSPYGAQAPTPDAVPPASPYGASTPPPAPVPNAAPAPDPTSGAAPAQNGTPDFMQVPTPSRCPKCGAALQQGDTVCPYCGDSIAKVGSASQTAGPQQPGQQVPPAAAYPPASPYGQPAPTASNGKAVGALVCGILAILLGLGTAVGGIILGIVAIVLGRSAKKTSPDGKATAGFICGIIGLIIGIVLLFIGIAAGVMAYKVIQEVGPAAIEQELDINNDSSSSNNSGPSNNAPSTSDNGSSSGKESSEKLNVPVANDSTITMTITKKELSSEGDATFYYTLTNNSTGAIEIYSNIESWSINGSTVDLYCYNEVQAGETVEDYLFTLDQDLGVKDVSEIKTVSGKLWVDTPNDSISYDVEIK